MKTTKTAKTTKAIGSFQNDVDRTILKALAQATEPVTTKTIGVSTEEAKASLKRLQNFGLVAPSIGKGSIKYALTDTGKIAAEEAAQPVVPEGYEDAVITPPKKTAKKAPKAASTPVQDPTPAKDPAATEKPADEGAEPATPPVLTIDQTAFGDLLRSPAGHAIQVVKVPVEGKIAVKVILTGKSLKAARDTVVTRIAEGDLTAEEAAALAGPAPAPKKTSTPKADRPRDPRLPAAGTILSHTYRDGRVVKIRTTETNEVIGLIANDDGSITEQSFSSISKAGTFFDAGHPVNGYVYFTLIPVTRKVKPTPTKITIDFKTPEAAETIRKAVEATGSTLTSAILQGLARFLGEVDHPEAFKAIAEIHATTIEPAPVA